MTKASPNHFGVPNPRRQLTDDKIAQGNQMRANGATYREIAAALGCSTETAQVYCGESQNASKTGYGDLFDSSAEYLYLLSPETRVRLEAHHAKRRRV